MEKSRIFIVSSDRTLPLADRLREELKTEFCEPELWSEETTKRYPGASALEALERLAPEYDFAVVLLSKDETSLSGDGIKAKDTSDPQKATEEITNTLRARDNCVFEAGFLMKALGRERCFLVNSVEKSKLPLDLRNILMYSFEEPDDLTDRNKCHTAIQHVADVIKDVIQPVGRMRNRPLSSDELMSREKLRRQSGDLLVDQVVVVSMQPLELDYKTARQVRTNIKNGVSYVYFFHGDTSGAIKTCQLLQMLLLAAAAPTLKPEEADDFTVRASIMKEEPIQRAIVEKLQKICERNSLKIFFLLMAPSLQYCIHNAADFYHAKLYFKRGDNFIEWEEGAGAYNFWKEEQQKQGIAPVPLLGVFHGASGFDLKESFDKSLERELKNSFPPVIHEQVIKLCFDGTLE